MAALKGSLHTFTTLHFPNDMVIITELQLCTCLLPSPLAWSLASVPLQLVGEARAHSQEGNLIYNREHTVITAHWQQR